MEANQRNCDSYQYQKEMLANLIQEAKGKSIHNFPNLELTLIQLNQFVNFFRIPFALLLLDPDIVNFLLNAYYEQLYQTMIVTLMTSVIEIFNFDMCSTSPVAELQKTLIGFGFKLNSFPKRSVLKDEEVLFDKLNAIEENLNVLKALPAEDTEEEKQSVLYQLDDAIPLYNKLKNDTNTHKSSIEFFSLLFTKLNEIKAQPLAMIDINDYERKEEKVNQFSIAQVINVGKSVSQFVSKIELKKRTFLYLNEKLSEGESLDVEYKNFFFPFKPFQEEEIREQICGMLNSKGGRIYIGINDEKIVKGIFINYKQRDLVRNKIVNSTYEFFPNCRTKKIDVLFLPVKNFLTNLYRPSLYVIKIIVHQGDTTRLYSLTSKRGYNAMIRLPGQVATLSAQEIEEEIIKRHQDPDRPIDESAFVDPEPERGFDGAQGGEDGNSNVNLDYINVNESMPSYSGKRKKGDTKKTFAVKVSGIPLTENEKSMEKVFANSGAVSMKFFIGPRANKGYGYLNFSNIENANKGIVKFNELTIKGKKIDFKIKDAN